MSRIARLPIDIPEGVRVDVANGMLAIEGPGGKLELKLLVEIAREKNQIKMVKGEDRLMGMTRSLISNMVYGVSRGWSKTLELSGTGYRATTNGKQLNLALGFSHPVVIEAPAGVSFEVGENKIVVKGADKVKIGEIAAKIRLLRPADPYKAKGFKYEGEVIVKKAGKAAKGGAVATK